MEALDCGLEFFALRNHIETSLGRDFFAFFRDETSFIGHDAQGNIDNLGRVAHFEIQLRDNVFTQSLNVAVLNVAAIRPQMRNDPFCTSALTHGRRCDRIGLGVLRFRHRGVTRLPQCRDVIDINSQAQFHVRANRSKSPTRSKKTNGGTK